MGTEWPMSADKPVGPAVLINQVGNGTVLTLAASPDFATASEHPIVEARKLLSQCGAVAASAFAGPDFCTGECRSRGHG